MCHGWKTRQLKLNGDNNLETGDFFKGAIYNIKNVYINGMLINRLAEYLDCQVIYDFITII